MKCYLFASICSLAFLLLSLDGSVACDAQVEKVVDVEVYYESLCPDSIRLFKEEILPSYNVMHDTLRFTFIPYGKASQRINSATGEWEFSCQHGPEECRGNMAQACAIHEIGNTEPAEKVNQLRVSFISCAMVSSNPVTSFSRCLKNSELSEETKDNINKCIKGPLSKELLAKNGDKTAALNPPLTHVPRITINGDTSQEIQQQALRDLQKLVCNISSSSSKPTESETV